MKLNNDLTLMKLLFSNSPSKLYASISLSIISGALYALIIPSILSGVSGEAKAHNYISNHISIEAFFFGLIALVLITKASSVILVNNLAKTAVARLRIDLSRKINSSEIAHVEGLGLSRILNVLTEDMGRLTNAAIAIPMVLVSTVTAIGMLIYLAVIDLEIFIYTILFIIFGLVLFQFPLSRTKKFYSKSRELKDVMQEGFRGLVFGAYELKLDKRKSEKFLDSEITSPTLESLKQEKKGDFILHLAGNSSEILCFFAIGIVIFLLPKGPDLEQQSTYGVVMALLYITGPIASVLSLMNQLKLGEISLNKINEIYSSGEVLNEEGHEIDKCWNSIKLKNIEYSYGEEERKFKVSVENLEFHKGKVYFIVGGNGSGKSTLCKVVSMHYTPSSGTYYFGSDEINLENIVSARGMFYSIYSDYYLFNGFYNSLSSNDVERIKYYMDIFKLKGKTELVDNKFSTIKLSDGQRRRLALLIGIIEDRDIYILDEWAADQDPEFKDLFYNYVIPDLKSKGKTIIAITHDDRYFHCCDEIIKIESGEVVESTPFYQEAASPLNEKESAVF